MWRRPGAAAVALTMLAVVFVLGAGPAPAGAEARHAQAGGSQPITTTGGLRVDPGMEETADAPPTQPSAGTSGGSPGHGATPGDAQGTDPSSTGQPSRDSSSALQLLVGIGMVMAGSVWFVRRNRLRASADPADERPDTVKWVDVESSY
ncbi:MAG TPA: hypothetical protein VM388_03880 [Acidimicrobiales bacterium]|nr:hypothetical protein [Acidimicrobiales bacterium]